MLTPKRLAAALRDMPPSTTAPTSVGEDRRKAPSPPAPSHGDNLQADQSRFGNPSHDSIRSETALEPQPVIPADAGIQGRGGATRQDGFVLRVWIPAFAGMTQ